MPSLPRLGVNIDHIATLRQQRNTSYPSLEVASEQVFKAGASQITIHLREDRRHIQDRDVRIVHDICKKYHKPLNLEMGLSEDIITLALKQKPEWICLVPEKREELTTEGGLNLLDLHQFEKIKRCIFEFREKIPNTKISLFVEASEAIMEKCLSLPINAVEIHTGEYCEVYSNSEMRKKQMSRFVNAFELIKNSNIGYHAGHGLTDISILELLELKIFQEYNIGHWIISQSLFEGFENVVRRINGLIHQIPLEHE